MASSAMLIAPHRHLAGPPHYESALGRLVAQDSAVDATVGKSRQKKGYTTNATHESRKLDFHDILQHQTEPTVYLGLYQETQ